MRCLAGLDPITDRSMLMVLTMVRPSVGRELPRGGVRLGPRLQVDPAYAQRSDEGATHSGGGLDHGGQYLDVTPGAPLGP